MLKRFYTIISAIIVVGTAYTSCNKPVQKKTNEFRQELSMPDFTLIKAPDSTIVKSSDIDKSGLVVIKYFSPNCKHCQNEAEDMVRYKDSLKNIKTIWMAGDWFSLEQINGFREKYKLDELNPISIGQNYKGDLIMFYDLKSVPYAAVYKDNQFIKDFRSKFNVRDLIKINNGSYKIRPKDSIIRYMKKPNPGYTKPKV